MKIGIGAVRLDTIENGVLAAGRVPFARLFKTFDEADNQVAIVLDSGGDEIFELDCGTLAMGDYVLANVAWEGLKDGDLGIVRFRLAKKSGDGIVVFPTNYYAIEWKEYVRYDTDWNNSMFVIGQVVTPGTYVLALNGYCYTGNYTVNIHAGRGVVYVL